MAYSAYQYSGGILYPEHASQIVIDSSADLADINLDVVAPGTRVVDCSSGSMYILSPGKVWKLIQNNVAAASKSVVTESASGDIAVITDGANGVAVKSLVAEITPVQSGSGDPSPDNIRPISGRTGLTVTRAGKNLFPSKTLSMGGTNPRTLSIRLPYTIPAGEYIMLFTVGGTGTGGWGLGFFYDSTSVGALDLPNGSVTLSAPANRIYAYMAQSDYSDGYTRILDDIQLELGTVATSYTPYVAPTTYTITWQTEAGTVYGGTLDLVSGELTIDRIFETVDGARITYAVKEGEIWRVTPNPKLTPSGREYIDGISNIYPWATSWSGMNGMAIGVAVNSSRGSQFLIRDDLLTSLADFKARFNETPLQLCYELATPQTYQLTPTEVRTILGGNNIYTDAGAVSVEYVADTKLYIDNKVAELQALILEN